MVAAIEKPVHCRCWVDFWPWDLTQRLNEVDTNLGLVIDFTLCVTNIFLVVVNILHVSMLSVVNVLICACGVLLSLCI